MPLQTPPNYVVDVPDPMEGVRKDLQFYVNMQQAQAQNNLINAQVQEHQLKAQAAQTAQARQAQLQARLQQFKENQTVAGIRNLMMEFPELSEHFKAPMESLTAEEKAQLVSQASQVQTAIFSGNTDVAAKLLGEYHDAYKASGNKPRADALANIKTLLQKGDTASALIAANGFMAEALGPEKYVENMTTLQRHPNVLRKEQADADKAVSSAAIEATEAKNRPALLGSQISQNKASAYASTGAGLSSRASATKTGEETDLLRATRPATIREAFAKAGKEEALEGQEKINWIVKAKTAVKAAETDLAIKQAEARSKGAQATADERTTVKMAEYNLAEQKKKVEIMEKTGLPLAEAELQAKQAVAQTALEKARLEIGIQQEVLDEKKIRKRFLPDQLGSEIAKTHADIRRADADVAKMEAEARSPTRSAGEQAELKTSADNAKAALLDAKRINTLAGEIKKQGWGGGGWRYVHRALEQVGWRTDWGVQRDRYIKEVNRLALMDLPRGPASDADLKFALAAFEDPNSSSERIAEALRRMARVREQDAKLAKIENMWVSENHHAGVAGRDMVIAGVPVKKNTTLSDFYDRLIPGNTPSQEKQKKELLSSYQ